MRDSARGRRKRTHALLHAPLVADVARVVLSVPKNVTLFAGGNVRDARDSDDPRVGVRLSVVGVRAHHAPVSAGVFADNDCRASENGERENESQRKLHRCEIKGRLLLTNRHD